MTYIDRIHEAIEALEIDTIVFVTGYDECILGIATSFGGEYVLVYSTNKIIEKLEADGMTTEEAWEFFDFNILGAYIAKGMPYFLDYERTTDDIEPS